MSSLRYYAFICLLTVCQLLPGQNVKISGSGKGYEGAELSILMLTDPVTKSQKPVSRITCTDTGSFSTSVTVNGHATVFIRAGIYTWYLYVTEGKEYMIKMADFIPIPPADEQNPFFSGVKLIPEIVNDTSDINNLVRKFDSVYDPAYNQIADRVAFNTKRGEIPSIVEKLNDLSTPGMPEFFKDFVKFRMIMINMVGSGEYPGRIEDSVIINRKFVPENPAYLDLIEQRFKDYFASLATGPFKNDFINALASSSPEDINKVMVKDGKISSQELREYVMLLNLFPALYDGSIASENIIGVFKTLMVTGSSQYIKDLAGIICERVTVISKGSPAPDFSLKDPSGVVKKISDFSGKYVLLNFTRSDNPAVMVEYGILNSWYKKYSAKFQVVTIITDRNFQSGYSRMKNAGFGWTMLDGSGQEMLEYLYNVKMYPAFVLVDPDGKIAFPVCPYPSENLEKIISVRMAQ